MGQSDIQQELQADKGAVVYDINYLDKYTMDMMVRTMNFYYLKTSRKNRIKYKANSKEALATKMFINFLKKVKEHVRQGKTVKGCIYRMYFEFGVASRDNWLSKIKMKKLPVEQRIKQGFKTLHYYYKISFDGKLYYRNVYWGDEMNIHLEERQKKKYGTRTITRFKHSDYALERGL